MRKTLLDFNLLLEKQVLTSNFHTFQPNVNIFLKSYDLRRPHRKNHWTFFTKVVVVCSAKVTHYFFWSSCSGNFALFFLSNGSGNVVTLKVTVTHHWPPVTPIYEILLFILNLNHVKRFFVKPTLCDTYTECIAAIRFSIEIVK